jgi:AmmeMemoRadiSam system protein B
VLDSHEILSLQNFPGFEFQDQAHAREHTLEVQLPFLQTVLDDFHLIPVLAGDATPQVLRPMLERYWATAHTLIVLSTNLSHHLDDISARKLDTQTCKAIEAMDEAHIGEAQACGRYPLRALLRVARHHHARVHTLAMGTSADHGGDRQRVTGFGAWSIEL